MSNLCVCSHLWVVAVWECLAVPTASCHGCGRCSSSGVWSCPGASPNQAAAMAMESSSALCKNPKIFSD